MRLSFPPNFGQIKRAYFSGLVLSLGCHRSSCDRRRAGRIQEIPMKKTLLAIAASALLAVATLAPTTADARCRGCGVGLGVVGGLAAGAIIGGAIAAGAGPAYAY